MKIRHDLQISFLTFLAFFILLIVAFEKQKVSILVKSNLPIFISCYLQSIMLITGILHSLTKMKILAKQHSSCL
jgi:hypothetical protein